MSLSESERQIIVGREMEKADRTFGDVLFCMKERKWETAANRLYYALFHAVSALLVHDGYQVKSHRGILALFGEYYVRTESFPKRMGLCCRTWSSCAIMPTITAFLRQTKPNNFHISNLQDC